MVRLTLATLVLTLAACSEAPTPGLAVQARPAALEVAPTAPLAFRQWLERYLAADEKERLGLAPEGRHLAEARRAELRALLLAEPETALALALTPVERAALPPEVAQHVERWRDGIGTLHVVAGVAEDGAPAPELERFVTFDGQDEVLRAGVAGTRKHEGTREGVRLHGVALDGVIAVTDRRLRQLWRGEPRPELPVAWPRACAVSRKQAEADLVFHGGDTLYGFCQPLHADQFDGTLADGETQRAIDQGLPPAAAWTEGPKTVLFVRVDFSDRTGDPIAQGSAETLLNTTVNQFFRNNSYEKTSLSTVVTPTLRLPKTRAEYQTGDQYLLLRSDALAAARAAGFDPFTYDLDVIGFASTFSGWAGRGYVGSRGTWLNGSFSLRTTAHELGHNYGVHHANFWNASDNSIIGGGASQEYGNPFDIMGTGGAQETHFNAWFKAGFNWVTPGELETVTSSGTYRVHALDAPISSGLHALKIQRDSAKAYWLEYRTALNNPHLRDGLSLTWGYQGAVQSNLLDVTPGDNNKNNSPLLIGRTFSDPLAGLHVTPVGKGGTTPESLDVVVNLGTFPGNQAPTVTVTASSTTPATGASVTFTATANDPDGDPLAYAWDFDDGTWGPNAATATRSFSAQRAHRVRVTVTDMKGQTTSAGVDVVVGTPTTFTLSGTITAAGLPLADVRVSDGTRATFTTSDGTWALTNVPAGSVTVSAARLGYTFARGFTAPLTVSSSQAALDFTATPVAGWSVRGKVTHAGTGLAGVVVTDGTRTATTNSSGDYTLNGVPFGRYTLTASKAGWAFNPSGFANPLDVLGGNLTGFNFVSTGLSFSGTVPAASVATAPVITDGVRTATATRGGTDWYWSLSGVPSGTWNLTATSPGVTLTPGNFTNPLTLQGRALNSLTFQVTPGATAQVRGTVLTGATPLPGVSVSDGARSAVTDELGRFTLVGVPAGSVTLTPSRNGYAFTPASRTVTVGTSDVTGQDFTTTVVNLPPTVAAPAAATPALLTTGTTTQLSVLGADDGGEAALSYHWHSSGSTLPTFSVNGSNAAKQTTLTFAASGTYQVTCVVTDAGGLTARTSVTVTVQQVLSGLEVSPTNITVAPTTTTYFYGTGKDQFGRAMWAGTPTWTVTGGGTIAPQGSAGAFTAGSTLGGPHTITATLPGFTASASVTIAGSAAPTIGELSATPNPVTGKTTHLAVFASKPGGGESRNFTYQWTALEAPSPVTIAAPGASATDVTFTGAGTYTFQVTVGDGQGNAATGTLDVTVDATPTRLVVTPPAATVAAGQTQAFAGTVLDQFDAPLATAPSLTWEVDGGGTIDAQGTFTAGAVAGGPFTVTASQLPLTATAQVTVTATSQPDTTPPQVQLTAPARDARLMGAATLTASATDDVDVVRVAFYADDTALLGEATAAPWTLALAAGALADGAHVLTARAFDAAGNQGVSDGVPVVVGALPGDVSPPAVRIVTPLSGASVTSALEATVEASDDVGVVSVAWELDGAVTYTATASPWSASLALAPGAHRLVAIASDAAGWTTRSAPVDVTVAEAGGPTMPAPETPAPPPEPLEPVIGGCGCTGTGGAPFHLGLLLLGLALRARRR